MTDSKYIFAGTKSAVMTRKLLSETERQLLIGAENAESFVSALHTTFLGVYLAHTNDDVESALTRAMLSAKDALVKMAPEPELFEAIWLRYDFYNLKLALKSELSGTERDEASYSPFGTLSPQTLARIVHAGNASGTPHALQNALSRARKNPEHIDALFDEAYLTTALDSIMKTKNQIMKRYIILVVDFFNIRSALRALRAHGSTTDAPFVSGASFTRQDLHTEEDVFKRLNQFGSTRQWTHALNEYQKEGNFTLIDKAVEEYLMSWLKRASIDLHSVAPMIAYLMVMEENVQFIRTVFTAKNVGLNEAVLRELIRTSFTAYAY
jgi:V/A-type H+/Na+-transporting ATPase subunit C